MDIIQVIGIHSHRTKPHTTKKTSLNPKSVNEAQQKRNEGVKHRWLLEILIQRDSNPYRH
jgi:hypothetical protein